MGFGNLAKQRRKVRRKSSSGPSESRTAAAIGKRAHQRGARSGPSVVRKAAPRRVSPEAGTAGKTKGQRKQQPRKIHAKGTVQVPVHYGAFGNLFRNLVHGPDMPSTINGHKVKNDKKVELRVLSPALTVLNETTRVSHGVAGGADALLSGHPEKAPSQAAKGLIHNKPYNFGKIFAKHGVPKGLASVAGFAADVGTDPLTYVTAGEGTVAKKFGQHEAEAAAERAAKDAGRKAKPAIAGGSKANESKGLAIKFAGKNVPGVTRATAPIAKAARKATPKAPASAAKRAAGEVNPRVAPEGVSKELHHEARKAARKARATVERARTEGQLQAHAIRNEIGPENYTKVRDAIEADKIDELPQELQGPAKAFADLHGPQMRQRELEAGHHTPELVVGPGEAKRYIYRATKERLAGKAEGGGKPTRTISPDFAKTRGERVPMAAHPKADQYSDDLALLHVARTAKSGHVRASAQLNKRLAELGRPVKPGSKVELKDEEALYRTRGADIEELNKVPEELADGEKLFVLPRAVETTARGGLKLPAGGPLATGFDTATRGFKRVAIATPGFNVRNLVGDQWNNYLQVPGHTIPANMKHGRRLVSTLNRTEKQMRKTLTPEQPKIGKATVEIPGEGKVSYQQLAREFAESGGGRSGQAGRELEELGRSAKSPTKVVKGVGRGTRRVLQNREDFPRAQTWLHFRLKGMSAEEATARSSEVHFDYGELSPVERNVFRRVMPFYTFSARNIPLQSRMLLQRPGKFANLQKAREESGSDKIEKKLSEYDQRQLPLLIHGGARSIGLPATDLNEFPVLALKGDLGGQADEYANRFASLVSPLIKSPVELKANFSFFFRDAIQNPNSPLVPAPAWVAKLPAPLKKKFGVTKNYIDKRSGKKTWGWYGKADYVAKQLPGIPNFAQNITTVSNRRGQSQPEKALAFLTGVKSTPADRQTFASASLGRLYKRQDEIIKRQRALNQQGVNAKNPNREYNRLRDEMKSLDKKLYAAKKQSGFKILPKKGGPKKPKGGYGSGGYGKSGGYGSGGY